MEKVKPIKITDNEKGFEYTLEYNRESVLFTNAQGFRVSEMEDNIEMMLPILFYGAFRWHHRNLSRQKADELLDGLMPVSQEFLIRLLELYSTPRSAMVSDDTDVERKNPALTVEL